METRGKVEYLCEELRELAQLVEVVEGELGVVGQAAQVNAEQVPSEGLVNRVCRQTLSCNSQHRVNNIIQSAISSVYLKEQLEEDGTFRVVDDDVWFFGIQRKICELYQHLKHMGALSDFIFAVKQIIVDCVKQITERVLVFVEYLDEFWEYSP